MIILFSDFPPVTRTIVRGLVLFVYISLLHIRSLYEEIMIVIDIVLAASHIFSTSDSHISDTRCHHGGFLVRKYPNMPRKLVAEFDSTLNL